MNRKLLILGSVFAVVLLAIVGLLLFSLYFKSSDSSRSEIRKDIYVTLPTDAMLLFDFNKFDNLESLLLQKNSPFSKFVDREESAWKFITILAEDVFQASSFSHLKNGEVLLSLHPSGKNELSLLYVNQMPRRSMENALIEEIKKSAVFSSTKEYDGILIYRFTNPEISVAFYSGCMVASPSLTTLESSIRHITNSTSLLENTLFESLVSRKTGEMSLFLNHQLMNRLISGVFTTDVMKHSEFIASISTWSLINVKYGTNKLILDGELLLTKDGSNYASLFASQKVKESFLSRAVPYNADYVLSIPFSSSKEFLKRYQSYMEVNKRSNNYKNRVAKTRRESSLDQDPELWFESLLLEEIGVVSVSYDKKYEKILLLRGKNISQLGGEEGMIYNFKNKGFISALLGDFLAPTSEDFFTVSSGFVLIGSKETLESYTKYLGETGFNMSQYLGQTPAQEQIRINNNFSFTINLNRSIELITKMLKPKYSHTIKSALGGNNFELGMLQVVNEDKRVRVRGGIYLENLSQTPVPKAPKGEAKTTVFADGEVVKPEGPFEVYNFVDEKINYFEQLPSNMLTLLDENRRSYWSIAFSEPICGYVEQVDYYRNDKLQMLFAAGSKVYLLDRLGRWVSNFPIDLGKPIVLGPKVFDYNKNKVYYFMLLHDDNTIGLYNLAGNQVEGWIPITTQEKIVRLPEELIVGENRYWVLRTDFQTLIYQRDGILVAEFSKKNLIKPDSKIDVISDSEVELTRHDGRDIVLNLESGKFK